jgi:hypothetical protein
MADNLVFAQSAANQIRGQLSVAMASLGDVTPADPTGADLGHPGVNGAAGSLFIGLKLYAANLVTATRNLDGIVEAAGESLGAFDQQLEALAAASPAAGVTNPLKTGDDADATSIDTGKIANTTRSRSSYRGGTSDSLSTTTNRVDGTVTQTGSHNTAAGSATYKNESNADGSQVTTITTTDPSSHSSTTWTVTTDANGHATIAREDKPTEGGH